MTVRMKKLSIERGKLEAKYYGLKCVAEIQCH